MPKFDTIPIITSGLKKKKKPMSSRTIKFEGHRSMVRMIFSSPLLVFGMRKKSPAY